MLLEKLNSLEKLAEDYKVLVNELIPEDYIESFKSGNRFRVFEEYYFSLLAIKAVCCNERFESMFLVNKEKESDFLEYYNGFVINLVDRLTDDFNRYNAFSGMNPETLIKVSNDTVTIKRLVEQRREIVVELSSKYPLKQEFTHLVNDGDELWGRISECLEEINNDFSTRNGNSKSDPNNLSWPQKILILKFRIDAGVEPFPTKRDIQLRYNNSTAVFNYYRYIAGRQLDPPKPKDVLTIIPYLADCLDAQKIASDYYAKNK